MSRDGVTLLEFGGSGRGGEPRTGAADVPRATLCKTCGQYFGADGRFCPFDGEPLVRATDWDPNSDPLLETTIDGRYHVESVIGEGGMGTVYKVRHIALGKRFALKALRKELANDGEIAARFIQEARTAASVAHPGIVEITDYGRLASGQAFFVMELLRGEALSTILRREGRLALSRALDMIEQIAEALKAAHDAGIVHRDLKPDNVHVGPAEGRRERLKLVDFGLARVIGAHRLTRAGVVFGTPHYMSPEQASGAPLDHRADIYALGVVMYEMFTGRVPFEADTYMGVLTKHVYMLPTPPSELMGDTAELGALEDVVLRCLEKKPEKRFADLGALLFELRRAVRPSEDGALAIRPGQRKPAVPSVLDDSVPLLDDGDFSGSKRRSSALVPALLVAVAFLAGLSLTVLSRSVPRAPAAASVSAPSTASAPPQPAAAERERPAGESPLVSVPSVTPAALPSAPPESRSARKPGRPAPVSQPTPRPKPPVVGGREIIDPWAGR